jgi:hypothetical protein
MANHRDSLYPVLANTDPSSMAILIGDKVKLIMQGRLRTAVVVGHYDGIVTARIGDVLVRRDMQQVVATKRR